MAWFYTGAKTIIILRLEKTGCNFYRLHAFITLPSHIFATDRRTCWLKDGSSYGAMLMVIVHLITHILFDYRNNYYYWNLKVCGKLHSFWSTFIERWLKNNSKSNWWVRSLWFVKRNKGKKDEMNLIEMAQIIRFFIGFIAA